MTAPDAAALLPCPFCGSPEIWQFSEPELRVLEGINCRGCNAQVFGSGNESAETVWNRRTPPADRACDAERDCANNLNCPGNAAPAAWMVTDRNAEVLDIVLHEVDAEAYRRAGSRVTPLYAAPAPPNCAKGWKLVPVELTKYMSDRIELSSEFRIKRLEAEELWWTFLQAAPPPPAMDADRAADPIHPNDGWYQIPPEVIAAEQTIRKWVDSKNIRTYWAIGCIASRDYPPPGAV